MGPNGHQKSDDIQSLFGIFIIYNIVTHCFALSNSDWLRMFSHRELQVLISGADHEIDVAQLRRFTSYGSGYDNDHPTVVAFWEVVEEMSETQKRRLLKFVTSCSRPPLLGFKVGHRSGQKSKLFNCGRYWRHIKPMLIVVFYRNWIPHSPSRMLAPNRDCQLLPLA